MERNQALEHNLTEGSVLKQLSAFALPILGANLLQALYSTVDMVVVGQFSGNSGLSSVTVGSQLMMLLMTIGMGFAGGGQVVVSQLKGAGNKRGLKEVIGALLTISVVAGIIAGVAGVYVMSPVLRFLNTPEESWDGARSYMLITSLGMVFVFVYNAVGAIMRGLGDSKRPLIFVAVAAVTNVLLDLLLVGSLGMGAAGAALATVMGQAIAAGFSIVYLYLNREGFAFDFELRSFRPRKVWIKELMRLGVPGMLQMSAITISLAVVLSFVNEYGVLASATVGVGGNILRIFSMPNHSVSQAASAMSGQNVGAGKLDRVVSIVNWALIINLGVFLLTVIIVVFFPAALVKMFNNDPSIIELATLYLRLHLINCLGHMFFTSYNAACLAVGNALLSACAFITDGVVVRLTLSLLFTRVFDWGLMGLFIASALAPLSVALIFGIYFYSGKWRTYRSPAQDNFAVGE